MSIRSVEQGIKVSHNSKSSSTRIAAKADGWPGWGHPIAVDVDFEKITIRTVALDDIDSKCYTFAKSKSGWHSATIRIEDEMPRGQMPFCEYESSEDKLVAFFEDLV